MALSAIRHAFVGNMRQSAGLACIPDGRRTGMSVAGRIRQITELSNKKMPIERKAVTCFINI
jgi:hypothetical protein